MVRFAVFVCLLLLLLPGCERNRPIDLEALKGRARGGEAAAFRELVGLLGVSERQVNDRVYPLLLELGEAAVPYLLEAVADPDRIRREHVIAALGTLKVRAAVEPIGAVLARGDWPRRYVAAWALGEIGAAEGIPFLLPALDDGDAEVRRYAVRSLIKFNRAAVDPLLTFLPGASARALPGAIRALGDIGDGRELSALLAAAAGPARQEALAALGKLKDPRAEALLVEALGDSDWRSRMNAAMALGALGGPAAATALERTLEDEVPVVREWSARSLEMITGRHVKYRDESGEYVLPYSIYH
jgi:HEAT repeat protein